LTHRHPRHPHTSPTSSQLDTDARDTYIAALHFLHLTTTTPLTFSLSAVVIVAANPGLSLYLASSSQTQMPALTAVFLVVLHHLPSLASSPLDMVEEMDVGHIKAGVGWPKGGR
jgi:hypothetical protein